MTGKRAPLKPWQFCVWTVFVTLGFACWLFLDRMWVFAGMLFMCGAAWVLISREEYLRPIPRKQVLWIFLGIGVFVALLVGQNLWWPGLKERGPDLEKWVRNPAIVIPFWALVVGLKFLLWQRCRAACVQS